MAIPFMRRSTKDKYPIVVAKEREFSEPRKPVQQQHRYDYKPFATRLPFLASILLLVIACIVAIELAFHYGSDTLHSDTDDAGTKRDLSSSTENEGCAVVVMVGVITTYYVSTESMLSSEVQFSSQTSSPTGSGCLARRQYAVPIFVSTTSIESYVYARDAESSEASSIEASTSSAAYATEETTYVTSDSTAYAVDSTSSDVITASTSSGGYAVNAEPTTCYVTEAVEVVVTYASSSIPVGTSTSSSIESNTQTNCATTITETMSIEKSSYLTNLQPTTCYATAYVDVEVTMLSSSIPVGTSFISGVGDVTGTNCATTVTETEYGTKNVAYATDLEPGGTSATSKGAYATDQDPCTETIVVTKVETYEMSGSFTYSKAIGFYTSLPKNDGKQCSTTTSTTTLQTSIYAPSEAATSVATAYATPGTPSLSTTPTGAAVSQISDGGPQAYATPLTPSSSIPPATAPITQTSDGQPQPTSYATSPTLSSSVPPSTEPVTQISDGEAYATPLTPSSSAIGSAASGAAIIYATPSQFDSSSTTALAEDTTAYVTDHTIHATHQTTTDSTDTHPEGPTDSAEALSISYSLSTSLMTTEVHMTESNSSGVSTMTMIVEVIYSTIPPSTSGPSTTYEVVTLTGSLTASSTTSLPSLHPAILPALQESQLVLGHGYTGFEYFCANYLGVLLAVILKGLWAIVFANAKMMEPFYQLHKPDGASVQDSLLANYLSTWLSWRSLKVIVRGQWAMLTATFSYAVMSALSPLSTEIMSTLPTAMCTINDTGDQQRCSLRWILQKPWARALEGVLITIAILIIIFMIIGWHRKSGVQTNPSTIASMASLLHHRETIDELRALDPNASNDSAAYALSGSTYKIEQYRNLDRSYYYGLARQSGASPTTVRDRYSALNNPHNLAVSGSAQSHFTARALRDTIFLLCVCVCFSLVLGYYLAKGKSPFNNFFNSGKWYARFILTSIAVLINLHWKTLEREVRVITPYRCLSTRHARPQETVLVALNGTPLTMLLPSLRRGDIFHAFIAFVAIMSDLLIIAIAGVPFSKTQVWKAFLCSAYTSIAILALMMLAVLALFIWRIQNEKMRLPREPDTLLGVWMMLCNDKNGIRKDFKGAHERDRMKEISDRCIREGKTYYAGWLDWDLREADGPEGREIMVRDEVTRRFVVDRDGEGKVVGYGHTYR